MKDLVIVGAGGTARDIIEAVEAINALRPTWRIRGLLDDKAELAGQSVDGYPVLGSVPAAARLSGAQFVIGVAQAQRPGGRRSIMTRLGLPADRFATILHPRAEVSARAELGPGCVALGNAIVSRGARLGRCVVVCQNAAVFHDAVLEDFVDVAPGAMVSGFAHVEAGAFLGSNSVVLSSKRVGAEAVVGMGCVVQQDIPAHCFVASPPARILPRKVE